MSDDPELLRLRASAETAEGRYLRLKTLLDDPATLTAAHRIWHDAAEELRVYQDKKPLA